MHAWTECGLSLAHPLGGQMLDQLGAGGEDVIRDVMYLDVQVSDQAMRPSGPGLWALGNKSRSGNNTSGDLLYSTDQQPAMWSAPAPLPPPGPPQAAVRSLSAHSSETISLHHILVFNSALHQPI